MEQLGDIEFDAKMETLMETDTSGKKKKKMKKSRKKWSKKRKVMTVGIVVILAVFLGTKLTGGKTKAAGPLITTLPLTKSNIAETLSLNGPVSGTDSVDVVSNLHAEVMEILVKEGDPVEKGQLLAVIDSTDIIKQVEMAQNTYDLATNTYKEQQTAAENGYAKAKQDYQAAKVNYDRTHELFVAGSVSQLELETADNVLKDANRQLSTFTLDGGKAIANESYALQIKSAEFELEQKKRLLENTQISSPIAGTVVRVNSKVGRFADKTEDEKPMFIIENLDVLEMKINVSEYSIGKVMVGQQVTIKADILNGESITGEVASISPTGEEKSGGSTERVIPTTIKIKDQNSKLIAGITAKAEIILAEANDTFVVPISAVLEQEGSRYVVLVSNQIATFIPVETGVESDIQVEIKAKEGSTLTEGMELVTTPDASMTDGMTVVVTPKV